MKYTHIFFSLISLSFLNCNAESLNDILPDPYPEVYETVNILPFDGHGWYTHQKAFKEFFSRTKVNIAIEVGSWLGLSTRDIAKMLPEGGILYAVDTWLGSSEHQRGAFAFHIPIEQLFPQFLSNVIHEGLQHRIIPVRMSSVSAGAKLKLLNLKADFIYLDAAHEYEYVRQDLRVWYPYLNNGGIFCGDDWLWDGVRAAVKEFAEENNLTIEVNGNLWVLL